MMQSLPPLSRPTLPPMPEPSALELEKEVPDEIYFPYYQKQIVAESNAFVNELYPFLKQKRAS